MATNSRETQTETVVNEINSISARVSNDGRGGGGGGRASANIPGAFPPSYDFATKNLEPINENLPPSYDSIYNRVRSVRRNIRVTVQNSAFPDQYTHKPLRQRLSYYFLLMICACYFIILPLTKIIVGIKSINQCPANGSLPFWLLIDGIFILLLAFSVFLFKYFDCSLMTSVICLFLFSWLVRGSVWVYRLSGQVSFNVAEKSTYCDSVCYLLTFWSITITWAFIAFLFLLIVVSVIYQNCKK